MLTLKRTVNRAARVAAQCEPGQVCVGVPMGDGEEPPDPGKKRITIIVLDDYM